MNDLLLDQFITLQLNFLDTSAVTKLDRKESLNILWKTLKVKRAFELNQS